MIVYEVNIDVDRAVAEAYLDWLRTHVVQMLRFDGFIEARIAERADLPDEAPRHTFVVTYRLRDRAALDAYFTDHATGMRADGERRFGGRFSANRRVLHELG